MKKRLIAGLLLAAVRAGSSVIPAEAAGKGAVKPLVMARANVDLQATPAGADRMAFAGSHDQLVEDAVRAAASGVDELFIDFYDETISPEGRLKLAEAIKKAVA